jgi:hypothetical protein
LEEETALVVSLTGTKAANAVWIKKAHNKNRVNFFIF